MLAAVYNYMKPAGFSNPRPVCKKNDKRLIQMEAR